MRVDVWSHHVCPWCAIGKAHVGAALQRFEHGDQVEVVCRGFEPDPGAPVSRDGADDALLAAEHGTSPAEGPRHKQPAQAQLPAADGLRLRHQLGHGARRGAGPGA